MRVAIFTGPTGGHFFPALAFLESLKRRHPEAPILLVTSRRGRTLAEKFASPPEVQLEFLPDFPFPRPGRADFLLRLIPFLIKLGQSFLRSGKILKIFRPDLCVGFGSYVAFPGMGLSRWRKIPTLIHEQNARMGQANLWLARWADRVALSFDPDDESVLSLAFRVTGLPLRRALVDSAGQKGRAEPPIFSEGRFRILMVGGSQGAHAMNELWTQVLAQFSDEEKSKLAVIHITGEKDFNVMKAFYENQRIEALVFPFHNRMEEIYPEADLAFTRAGASTLFELALFRLPAIVIPYPHAEGHQEKNARYFENSGALRVFEEKNSTPENLKVAVGELMNSDSLRKKMQEALGRFALSDAAERLVELGEELIREKEVCTV